MYHYPSFFLTLAIALLFSEYAESALTCKTINEIKGQSAGTITFYDSTTYASNQDCQWIISAPELTAIRFTFTRHQLHKNGNGDYVYIYDGSSISATRLYLGTDQSLPGTAFTTSSNNAVVRFTSDNSYESYGFIVDFIALPPCQPQPNVLTNTYGEISNDLAPDGNYLGSQKCYWQITVSNGEVLKFKFSHMDINDCNNDWVMVYDGESTGSPELGKYCGTTLPANSFAATANKALILFKTNEQKDYTGFKLLYEAYPSCPDYVVTLDDDSSGYVENEIFEGTYLPMQNCRWKIEMSARTTVRLTFEHLDLEYGSSACPNDFVAIYDGTSETAPLLVKACGTGIPAPINTWVTSKNTAFVQFKTNRLNEKTGFRIKYDSSRKPNEYFWPRPSKLKGFWPLDNRFQTRDASGNACHGSKSTGAQLRWDIPGPFGEVGTSFSAAATGIFSIRDPRLVPNLAITNSFTISFFIRVVDDIPGGILQFYHPSSTMNALSIEWATFTKMLIYGDNKASKAFEVFNYNVWNFVAMVYNRETSKLSVYGKRGLIYQAHTASNIGTTFRYNADGFSFGFSQRNKFLAESAAMTCLMIYDDVLTETEIFQAHDACRKIQQSTMCGQPRLAMPPLPAEGKIIPSAGEMPWLASIRRDSKHICTASVIDSFWVLTAASCFNDVDYDQEEPFASYLVVVGEYDTEILERPNRNHAIRNVMKHPDFGVDCEHAADLALVELTTAVDFSNNYVSDICLPRFGITDIETSTKVIFGGWGSNGRNPLVSQTLPRLAHGETSPDAYCLQTIENSPSLTFINADNKTDNVPCSGDEGAPLMQPPDVDSEDYFPRLTLVGVYSGRPSGQCKKSYAPVFSALSHYMPWITETIACTLPGEKYPIKCPL